MYGVILHVTNQHRIEHPIFIIISLSYSTTTATHPRKITQTDGIISTLLSQTRPVKQLLAINR